MQEARLFHVSPSQPQADGAAVLAAQAGHELRLHIPQHARLLVPCTQPTTACRPLPILFCQETLFRSTLACCRLLTCPLPCQAIV